MTTATAAERPMTYVPGGTQFTYPARERRTPTYRTWLGAQDMRYCVECLLCGSWESSNATREEATRWGTETHPRLCHVVTGCHCLYPHITAAVAARLGIGNEVPRHLTRTLFRLAGGRRKYCPPAVDRYGTPHHALMNYLAARVGEERADGAELAEYRELLPDHQAWLAAHWAKFPELAG